MPVLYYTSALEESNSPIQVWSQISDWKFSLMFSSNSVTSCFMLRRSVFKIERLVETSSPVSQSMTEALLLVSSFSIFPSTRYQSRVRVFGSFHITVFPSTRFLGVVGRPLLLSSSNSVTVKDQLLFYLRSSLVIISPTASATSSELTK